MDTDSDIIVRYSLPENFFVPDPSFSWDNFNIDLDRFARDIENSYTPSPYQDVSVPPEVREALKIVAKGIDGLDVLIKGIAQALKLVPGVPPGEVRRFEALDNTLGHISLSLKAGSISEASAKAAVKDGLEVAFGEASDFALALAVGYMSNHITELLPGYGKLIPFAAIIGTYIASQATDKVGEAVAAGVTEVVFAAIDLAINSSHWIPNGITPASAVTGDLILHPSDTYITGELGHYDYKGFHGPSSAVIFLDNAPGQSGSGVGALYQQYAGRIADNSELEYWQNQIDTGGADLNSIKLSLISDINNKPYLTSVINATFQNYSEQSASAGDVDYWISHISQGGTFADMRSAVISSQGGYAKFLDILDYIYIEYAGREPTASETAHYRAVTIANNNDFESVSSEVISSQEGQNFVDSRVHSLMISIYGRDTTSVEFATFKAFVSEGGSFDALRASIIQCDAPYQQDRNVSFVNFGGSDDPGYQLDYTDPFFIGWLPGKNVIISYFDGHRGDKILLPASLMGSTFDQLDIKEVFSLDNSVDVIITGRDGIHLLLPDTTLAELTPANILIG